MFEVFEEYSGETVVVLGSEEECWQWIQGCGDHANLYDVRALPLDHELVQEDTWPEYETVMEMEKWQ